MPLTLEQHERKLHDPAMAEQLPIRDYLDNIMVRTNGSFVAGYELAGLASYFAHDLGKVAHVLERVAGIDHVHGIVGERQALVEIGDDIDAGHGKTIDADEAWALDALRNRLSFGEICAGLCQWR